MTDLPRTHTDQAGFLVLAPEPWVADGACVTAGDPDAWFPDPGGATEPAKQICRRCDVTDECFAYAVRTGQTAGIWGGRAPRQIREARRRQT